MLKKMFAKTVCLVSFTLLSPASLAEELTLEDSLKFLKTTQPSLETDATVESLSTIDTITLSGEQIADNDFKYLVPLCKLNNIEKLDFRFSKLTGKGFQVVAEKCGRWDSIVYIDLGGSPLVDEYLTSLNAFPNLQGLNIDFHDDNAVSQISGNFFKSLRLEQLSNLWAVGTNLSDENALHILNWHSLEVFNFGRTPITTHTLQELRKEKMDPSDNGIWNLKRIKYQAQHFLSKGQKPNYEEGLEQLTHALTLKLLISA